jgi:hypothetical protein
VISSQYFDECAKARDFPSYSGRDELVLAGVRLYRVLWGLMSSNVIQKTSAIWPEIDSLRKSQENIYSECSILLSRPDSHLSLLQSLTPPSPFALHTPAPI